MSKNKGKDFEKQWRDSYDKTPYLYIRLQDSNKWINSSQTRFTPQNPFDGIQYAMPFIFLLELKSTGGSGFSFNKSKPYEKPKAKKTLMIKPHQVKELMEAANKEGVISGFVLNFRPRKLKNKITENATYFVHINDFIKFAEGTNKASINEADCKEIGLRIGQRLKRVKYVYDIEQFVRDAIHMCFNKGYFSPHLITRIKQWIKEVEIYGDSATQ